MELLITQTRIIKESNILELQITQTRQPKMFVIDKWMGWTHFAKVTQVTRTQLKTPTYNGSKAMNRQHNHNHRTDSNGSYQRALIYFSGHVCS